MLLVSLSLWKLTTFCIHCSPLLGESGWMYILFGISGSAFPATIHLLLRANRLLITISHHVFCNYYIIVQFRIFPSRLFVRFIAFTRDSLFEKKLLLYIINIITYIINLLEFNLFKIHYDIRSRSEEKHVRPVPCTENDFVESIFQ